MTIKFLKCVAPFLALFLLSNFMYCQNTEFKESPVKGTWIEWEKKTDTIVFKPYYDGQDPIFELKRSSRLAEGHKLPGYFSGPYSYKLGDNSISVFWFLSSSSFQTYYFSLVPGENKFFIGNFYKDPEKRTLESDTLTFRRID